MNFRAERKVLDCGVKLVFAVIYNIDNSIKSPEYEAYRNGELRRLYDRYKDLDVREDPILEGFNILHDKAGVKRRKNIPASINLIKLLVKNGGEMPFINTAVDIYNILSLESRLSLGAHNIDAVSGDVTLRFTDGSEKYIPLGQTEPVPVAACEYCYCDDDNEVLCRLEVRQVNKTKVDESCRNVFYIVQGNEAVSDALLIGTAQRIIDTTSEFCGGKGKIIMPEVI